MPKKRYRFLQLYFRLGNLYTPIPPQLWREFRYEDTTADLSATARRALEFLDLPWDEGVLAFHEHARKKHVHSPTYAAVTEPVHRRAVGRWQRYARWLEPHLKLLDPFVDGFSGTQAIRRRF